MRIGVITDIHENVNVLRNALILMEKLKCDEIICLGDIVGYDSRFYDYEGTRSAGECVRIVKSTCRWVVPGNHDLFATGRFPVYSNGYKYPESWFRMSGGERKNKSSGKVWCFENEAVNDLTESELEYLRTIPEFETQTLNNKNYLFSHYIVPDFTGSTTRYIERNGQMNLHWEFMKQHDITFSIIGHAHNSFAGFAYRDNRRFLKAFHSLPNNSFYLGKDPVVILLPPLSGEKGRTGFSVFDTDTLELSIISNGNFLSSCK